MEDEKDSNVYPDYMRDFVFHCARDGLSLVVSAYLKELSKHDAQRYLEQLTIEWEQKMTPLMAAARNGHHTMVKILLKEFEADPNILGSVKFDGYMVENVTALWCAAAHGHLKVVKALVQAKAGVNHITQTYSTPLRAACYIGRLDIIKYLVTHGASLNVANKFNNSCLMIASYRGHYHVVNYLLDEGMDPNEVANCGATPLFYASHANYYSIVKLLLSRGAIPKRTKHGMTPAMAAAEKCNEEIVDFFVFSYEGLSLMEKINTLELLGASFANDRGNQSNEKAYFYLRKAMLLRYLDPNNCIPKPMNSPIRAYNYWVETQNLDELDKISRSSEAIHMEALVIRERILGQSSQELLNHILYRGAVFADNGQYHRCVDLWFYAIKLCVKHGYRIALDLMRLIQIFCKMERLGLEIQFSMLKKLLVMTIKELNILKESKEETPNEDKIPITTADHQITMLVTLHLLVLAVNLTSNEKEKEDLYELGCKLNKVKARNNEGKTFLHLSVDPSTPELFKPNNSTICFPCPKTTKLLLECGADVNALDKKRNTPLHTVATYRKSLREFKTLHSIITLLTEAEAHMDFVNLKGETPIDSASSVVAEVIFKTQTKPPLLKCLCARIVASHSIKYVDEVPVDLISFIKLHGPDKNADRFGELWLRSGLLPWLYERYRTRLHPTLPFM